MQSIWRVRAKMSTLTSPLLTCIRLGLTGGLLDAGALSDALTMVLTKGYDESILDKYAQVRRDVFLNVINPVSQANLRRLWKTDPETAGDTDPYFRSLRESDPATKEKMRRLGELRVDILQNKPCPILNPNQYEATKEA